MFVDALNPINMAHPLNQRLYYCWVGLPGARTLAMLPNYAANVVSPNAEGRIRHAAFLKGTPPNGHPVTLYNMCGSVLWGFNPGDLRPAYYETNNVYIGPYNLTVVITLVPYAPSELTYERSYLVSPIGAGALSLKMLSDFRLRISEEGIAELFDSPDSLRRSAINQVAVSIVRTSPIQWTVCVNGEVWETGTYSGSMNYYRNIYIGSEGTYRNLHGLIGEARLYFDRALTPQECKLLYNEFNNGYPNVLNWVRPRRGSVSTGNRRRRVLICGASS